MVGEEDAGGILGRSRAGEGQVVSMDSLLVLGFCQLFSGLH